MYCTLLIARLRPAFIFELVELSQVPRRSLPAHLTWLEMS